MKKASSRRSKTARSTGLRAEYAFNYSRSRANRFASQLGPQTVAVVLAPDVAQVAHVEVSAESITAHLTDGRVISVPLAWSWRLSDATPKQRANWELIGDGYGIHWPDVDEDISADGMLNGTPARRPTRLATAKKPARLAPKKRMEPARSGSRKRAAHS